MIETTIYWVGAAVLVLPLMFWLYLILEGDRTWGLDDWLKYGVWVSLWTVILSHAWHILIGEASVKDFTDGQTFFAFVDFPAFELDLDSAWLNTYEFTVALELLVLKAFAGWWFWSKQKNLGYLLLIDAVLSFLIYGFGATIIPDIDFQTIDLLGLIASTFWLSWGWAIFEEEGDGWLIGRYLGG